MTRIPIADESSRQSKRTRKPSPDKGKGRGKRTTKPVSVKPGPKCARKLYYRLLSEETEEDLSCAHSLVGNLLPLTSLTPSDAVREVLELSQRDENTKTHLGRACQIIGLLDKFTISGKVHVRVKAER